MRKSGHIFRRPGWPRMPVSWQWPMDTTRIDTCWELAFSPCFHQYVTNLDFKMVAYRMRRDLSGPFTKVKNLLNCCRDRRMLFRGGPSSPFQLPGHAAFDHEFRADGKYRVLSFVGREVLHEDYAEAERQVEVVEAEFKLLDDLMGSVKNFDALFRKYGISEEEEKDATAAVKELVGRILKEKPNATVEELVGGERTHLVRGGSPLPPPACDVYPLRGLFFDEEERSDCDVSNEAAARKLTLNNPTSFAKQLLDHGAVLYGISGASTANLPHPTHSGLAVGGPGSASALGVACGLSSLSCTSSDCRVAAGLLGVSGCRFGAGPHVTGLGISKCAQGMVARNVADVAHVLDAVCGWATLGEEETRGKILALDEFRGPGTAPPTVAVHPVVKKWFEGVRRSLGHLNVVHHSDYEEKECANPPHISDITHQHPAADSKAESVLSAAGRNADILRRNGIQFVLSPLLRVPYLAAITGSGVDPALSPYCALGNAWETASITIPLPICALPADEVHCGDTQDLPPLPYALLLTMVPPSLPREYSVGEGSRALQQLVVTAEAVASALKDYAAPPLYIDELWHGMDGENARAAGYPPWNCTSK